jgi:hypothetical protein
MCCKLFYIVRQDQDRTTIYVRGAIDGVYKDAERLVKGDLGNGIRIQHPTAFALRACEYADERNSVIVGEYVEQLIDLEEQLNDDHLAGHTSFELNNLSRKLGEVRICIQYVKTAAGVMREHLLLEEERHLGRDWSPNYWKLQLESKYSIGSLEKNCDQRLLDVELIQRRGDNALLVVRPRRLINAFYKLYTN